MTRTTSGFDPIPAAHAPVRRIGLREHLWMGMQNTAIARIDYAERGDLLAVLYTCRVAHLPLDMIT